MKFVKKYLLNIVFYIAILTMCAPQVSCTHFNKTITVEDVIDSQISWDGVDQNSGLIEYIDNKGFVITENAYQRYLYLSKKYGHLSTPPVKAGQGAVKYGENYLISNQYMVEFIYYSQINKNKKDE